MTGRTREDVLAKARSHENACTCPSCEAAEDEQKMRELLKQLR